jgi:hypothetical protein
MALSLSACVSCWARTAVESRQRDRVKKSGIRRRCMVSPFGGSGCNDSADGGWGQGWAFEVRSWFGMGGVRMTVFFWRRDEESRGKPAPGENPRRRDSSLRRLRSQRRGFVFLGERVLKVGHPRVNPVEQKKQIPRCARDDMFFCLWKKEPQDAGLKAWRYKTWICAGVPVPRGWGGSVIGFSVWW